MNSKQYNFIKNKFIRKLDIIINLIYYNIPGGI
jgi:hypothetical protein